MPKAKEARKPTPHAEIAADVAKRTLGQLLGRAGYGNERIIITRNGKALAALVPASDLELLDGAA